MKKVTVFGDFIMNLISNHSMTNDEILALASNVKPNESKDGGAYILMDDAGNELYTFNADDIEIR